ncbi:MAG: HAMP domain-containing histidine kinase [Lachnospiraceae bacterium]|jgi:signal transduction histidine kinase|nr:HAMP domain-containing histidine kinase [Lachnospiraceae bacterium]
MKHSIRTQYAGIFILLMAGTIFITWFINNTFLEEFYVNQKWSVLRSAHKYIDEAFIRIISSEASEEDDETDIPLTLTQMEDLDRFCFKNNIIALVIDFNSNYAYASSNGGIILEDSWRRYFFSVFFGASFLDDTQNRLINGDNMEFFGVLTNGYSIVLRTPLESIRESAKVANLFLAYVGGSMILVSGIMAWMISKKITKPILELTRISERMIHLDFEAKYEGSSHNETSLLGENINQLSESLEKTISELKTANNELKTDIEKKEKIDAMRKEFLSNVSHELKTPIALIQGYAEGLQEGIHDDFENREFYCEVIIDEAAKMNQMVQKLLTLNQLEFGTELVSMERFDLVELIRSCLSNAVILLKQNEITIRMPEYSPTFVWADQFKIEEVFLNYLTNAMHHCQHEKLIDIHLELDGKKVKVGVFNTGEPIPEESKSKIWDKFYKVDKARTREYGGSGIGLSIVKAIMESMNQEYGVENYANGVQFWFTLDLVVDVGE